MTSVPPPDVVTRIQMEYIEMPDLRLTERQARRLWNLSEDTCATALSALVKGGFLRRAHDAGLTPRAPELEFVT